MNSLEKKFDLICKPIPTYALSDEIGLDTETSYILDLTTEENFKIANEYLKSTCFEDYTPIPDSYIGEVLIMEYSTNGGTHGDWYSIHGNIDQYFKAARATLERYVKALGLEETAKFETEAENQEIANSLHRRRGR